MNKESEVLNYLVELALDGEKEIHHGKIFDSEEIILEAIKRNEPKKVVLEYNTYKGCVCNNCPVCGETLRRRYYNYCPVCGQALDWSRSNE